MVPPERLDLLQRQWVSLLGSYGATPAAAYPVFDELVATHAEPHRHYHTLEHVAEMLRVVGRLAGLCTDVRAVQLAVWFHDAVYDPTAKDNEERSATLAGGRLEALGVPADVVGKVVGLVRATAHLTAQAASPEPDTAVLLDADLAVLGASEQRYRRYAADVRKEYAFVPDADYRAERAAVLERFLARDRIYLTEPLLAEGETSARRNLRAEIDSLRQ